MDAVTFGASWASPFAAEASSDGPFTLADGSVVDVPMMRQMLSAAYVEGDGWTVIELPYTEGFAMRIVLPDEGQLTQEQWAAVRDALAGAGTSAVSLTMPRWETDATLDLTPALAAWVLVRSPIRRATWTGCSRGPSSARSPRAPPSRWPRRAPSRRPSPRSPWLGVP